jgi:predicted nucleotidyltransferase
MEGAQSIAVEPAQQEEVVRAYIRGRLAAGGRVPSVQEVRQALGQEEEVIRRVLSTYRRATISGEVDKEEDHRRKPPLRCEDVQRLVAAHRAQIEERGVKRLALLGAIARGKTAKRGPVEFLVEYDSVPTLHQFMAIVDYLQDLLGRKVVLATRKFLPADVRSYVEKDAVDVL